MRRSKTLFIVVQCCLAAALLVFFARVSQDPRAMAGRAIVWLIVFLISEMIIAGLVIAVHQHRQRRQREGRCRTCGYDLRASPDHCPECGAVTDAKAP